MTDFPRGWTLSTFQNASGLAPSITVAGVPGVVHVLDAITAKATAYAATAGALAAQLAVTTAAGTVLTTILAVPGGAIASDSVSFSGLGIASSVGGTIAVAFNTGAGASQWEEITIQGHDI